TLVSISHPTRITIESKIKSVAAFLVSILYSSHCLLRLVIFSAIRVGNCGTLLLKIELHRRRRRFYAARRSEARASKPFLLFSSSFPASTRLVYVEGNGQSSYIDKLGNFVCRTPHHQ